MRGACGDTPSPSAAATARIAHERREGASYKQVMIVFLASQRDPHKSDIKHALHLSVPSPRFSPGYRIHVISQPVSSVPRPSPLLLTTSHGDAAGVWLCSVCGHCSPAGRCWGTTGQDKLTHTSGGESGTRGFATPTRYEHSLIILHLQSASGNSETNLRKLSTPHTFFRYYTK